MNNPRQIFQTRSKWRWQVFKWSGRTILTLLLMMIPVAILTMMYNSKPLLPILGNDNSQHPVTNPSLPKNLDKEDLKKYNGFQAFLRAKKQNEKLRMNRNQVSSNSIRAAFYVDWDPQSFYSLQKNIDKLNMVIPEWFFIDPVTDTLVPRVDVAALALMQRNPVTIIALLNNINENKGTGDFDGNILHRILHNKEKKERLINDIVKYLTQYRLQGINIDFEELHEKTDEPLIAFQEELWHRLHPMGLLVTQDIIPGNEDFNVRALMPNNDYIFLMAYDEHYSTSVPGAVSSQQWIEKVLDQAATDIPSEKIILCLAAYGYDWTPGEEALTLTYQQAMATAKEFNTAPEFDNTSYNNHFSYTAADKKKHEVYFTDAATNFNCLRFADEYGTGGTALWRLGSEDERLWLFYNRNLSNRSVSLQPFDFSLLRNVIPLYEKPDYIGDGEILNVMTSPESGNLEMETDPAEAIISEERYIKMPSTYVIQKYGKVHRQVILSFDDGPDPVYTPQILDILKKEKVPGVFFIVGMEAENNLPLLNRIFREGHEIGNHTFTHPNIAGVSAERAMTELQSTRLLIESVTGHSTVLFRAPYNADAEPSTEVELRPVTISKNENYYTVGESIDPNDWESGVTSDSIYASVIRQYEHNPDKGIILLHDAGGNRQATVDALPRIIHYFKNKGIAFTNVAGLLGVSREVIMPPVSSTLLRIDNGIAHTGYWIERFLSAAFWVAIIAGLIRVLLMAVMAIADKIRNRHLVAAHGGLTDTPPVTIIVPAFNEEINAVNTVNNLLLQDYPDCHILFVDDGSRDATLRKVKEAFDNNSRVTILTKVNGGKASALNYGIERACTGYLVCIDADTQLKPDAVSQLMKKMMEGSTGKMITGAVAGNVKVGNENTLLTKWQSIEYTTAQNFDRRAFNLINAITVVPGAIGAFRKEAIEKAGGFTTDTLAEDCDLTIRILRTGYRVVNCPDAIAVTEAPETLRQFLKQRFRWSYGIMQAFWKNRYACFNPGFKGLGLMALPNILIFQVLLPLLAPAADLLLLLSIFWNRYNPENLQKIGWYYLLFLLVDVLISVLAFFFEKEKPGKLIWLIPQRFAYRQLMYYILFKSLVRAIKGENQGWGVLKRTGNIRPVSPVQTSS